MFDPESRYAALETALYTLRDGRAVAYKRRRFLPDGNALAVVAEVTVEQGDRLDLLTARTLGPPEYYWRLCDANNAMRPRTLVEMPGRRLRLSMPGTL